MSAVRASAVAAMLALLGAMIIGPSWTAASPPTEGDYPPRPPTTQPPPSSEIPITGPKVTPPTDQTTTTAEGQLPDPGTIAPPKGSPVPPGEPTTSRPIKGIITTVRLPDTGTPFGFTPAVVGLLLVAGGSVIVWISRRRDGPDESAV